MPPKQLALVGCSATLDRLRSLSLPAAISKHVGAGQEHRHSCRHEYERPRRNDHPGDGIHARRPGPAATGAVSVGDNAVEDVVADGDIQPPLDSRQEEHDRWQGDEKCDPGTCQSDHYGRGDLTLKLSCKRT